MPNVPLRDRSRLSYLANYTHRVALSNRRILAVDAQHQSVTFTCRDYGHGSQLKDLTLSALEFPALQLAYPASGTGVYPTLWNLGNNRRRRDIEAGHAIFKRHGCGVDLQPQSVVNPPCGATCCPLCGKAEHNPLWVRSTLAAVFVCLRGHSLAIRGYRRGTITAPNLLAPVQSCFSGKRMNQARYCEESVHEESHGIGLAPIMCRTSEASVKATRRFPR